MSSSKQTAGIAIIATGVGLAAGILLERSGLLRHLVGCFIAPSDETVKSSTRETATQTSAEVSCGIVTQTNTEVSCETATQTSSEVHFQPRPPITECLKKKNEQLRQRILRYEALSKKKLEQLRQRILKLSRENKALKWERDDLAVREAKANMERDEAVQAKSYALLITAEAVRAEKEARRVVQQVTLAKDVATREKDLAVIDRDEVIRDKKEAIWAKNEATFAIDLAIRDRDRAIEARNEHKEQTSCAVRALAREKMAAIFARDKALIKVESLRRELALIGESFERRLQQSRGRLVGRFEEVLRRVVAAIAERNSLRSITMNPPQ